MISTKNKVITVDETKSLLSSLQREVEWQVVTRRGAAGHFIAPVPIFPHKNMKIS